MYLFIKCKFVKFLMVLIDNKGWFPTNNFMILSFKLLFSFDFWALSFLLISSISDIIDSDFFFIVNDLFPPIALNVKEDFYKEIKNYIKRKVNIKRKMKI